MELDLLKAIFIFLQLYAIQVFPLLPNFGSQYMNDITVLSCILSGS